MKRRKIVIDTDPGQDDAIAILLALASPELEVLGITAVAGNVSLHHTAANALRICELAGRPDIPVRAGCPRPLLREPVSAAHVHGETGLDGAGLPAPVTALAPGHAVEWIVGTLRAATEPLTLCPLGPLTNLAAAIVQAPDIVGAIAEVVAMGGATRTHGNVTPSAEFNVYADPHAADVVLRAGCPVSLMPLELTHQALTTPARLERFRELPAPIGPACHGMLSYYYRPNSARFALGGSPLHDPCVIAYLVAPDLFEGERVHVAVETTSPLTLGATVSDRYRVTGKAANCTVMHGLDAERFFDLLFERLARLPA